MQNEIPQIKHGRRLIWQDEFNAGKLDMSKWCFWRTMYNPSETYVNDEKHVHVEDGMLQFAVHRDQDGITNCQGLTTKYTMLFQYGYLEMRARLPFRHGAWPSFWLLGKRRLCRRVPGKSQYSGDYHEFLFLYRNDRRQ